MPIKPLQCSWNNITSDRTQNSGEYCTAELLQHTCWSRELCLCLGCCFSVQGHVEGLQLLLVKEVSCREGQTELLSVTVWHRCCRGSRAPSSCCMCHMFPGKYGSGTASSPFPESVRVPGRDYLCLISSLAALHRPPPSQPIPQHIYRWGINHTHLLTGLRCTFVQCRLLRACLLRKFSYGVFPFWKVFI